MSTHVALLRGINVGGRNKIPMADLRDLLVALGFADAKSLLQSGNLVFRSDRRTGAKLEQLLEAETKKRFDLSIDFLVRSAVEWEMVVSRNPFPDAAEHDPSHLLVMFLKTTPAAKDVQALQAAIVGPEVVHADGNHLYAVYPAGIGDSKLTNTLIERKLGARGTGRNWNTILKLAAMTRE